MLNIAHKITLGSTSLTSRLLDLETRAGLDVPVHVCRVVLDAVTTVSAAPGDDIKIELGYDKNLTKVFSGKISSVARGIETVTIEGASSFTALTAARINSLYEKQNAGDIVSDLLGKLDVKKGTVEAGEKFASFTVSDQENAWSVIAALAARCGFDFYADPEDKAVFKKYAAAETHAFEYGIHILDFSQDTLQPALDGVEVYGESPVGQGQGDDASAWLTKKTVKGSAGETSGNVLHVIDAAARTQELVRALAGNLLKTYQIQARGRMRVLGEPTVKLGDAIKLSKMPDTAQNGTYKVTSIRQRLNRRVGFVTDVAWLKVES